MARSIHHRSPAHPEWHAPKHGCDEGRSITAFATAIPVRLYVRHSSWEDKNVSVVDDVRQQISKRLKELKPLVDEYHQLEAMVRKLAAGDGALSSPGRSSTRRRTTRSTDGRRRGRPRGSGTRSAQALALVEAKPGITIPEMAKEMGITPNYLYRVLPQLAKDGKVKKTGKGWEPSS